MQSLQVDRGEEIKKEHTQRHKVREREREREREGGRERAAARLNSTTPPFCCARVMERASRGIFSMREYRVALHHYNAA